MVIEYKNKERIAKNCDSKKTNKNKKTKLDSLNDYGKKDVKWSVKKYRSSQIERILFKSMYPTHNAYAKRVRDCANRVTFKGSVCNDTGEFILNLSSAFFCHFRHCPICDWRRSLRSQAIFKNALPKIMEENPRSRWLFLTLTVENCEIQNLRETIGEMNKAFERMIKRKAFSFIKGWIRKVEVTQEKNRKNYAHPHFHCLIMVNESYFKNKGYLTHKDWVKYWTQAMRSKVDLTLDIQGLREKVDPNGKALVELLKTFNYSVKTNDIVRDDVTTEWFFEYINQVHALKFLTSGGELKNIFRRLKIDDESDEELINVDDQNIESDSEELDVELSFGYQYHLRQYIKIK